jgi:hypothetical protein
VALGDDVVAGALAVVGELADALAGVPPGAEAGTVVAEGSAAAGPQHANTITAATQARPRHENVRFWAQ